MLGAGFGRALVAAAAATAAGAAAATGCYAPAPGEGVPCTSRGECPTGLACSEVGLCVRDPAPPPSPPPPLPSPNDLADSFDRPDGPALGNGWIEKSPATYAIAGGAVVRIETPQSYRDNMVYRPAAEDVRDVEVSVRVRFTALPPRFAQIFARASSATIAAPGSYDGYLLYVEGERTDEMVLGRQRGAVFVATLSRFSLSPPIDTASEYRLVLRATGAGPVSLAARVDRLEAGAWVPIGETAVADAAPEQLVDPGTVGFSGDELARYVYDDFRRVDLTPQRGPAR